MRDPITHAMIMETDAETSNDSMVLVPNAAWIAIHFHLPEDVQELKDQAPDLFDGGPDVGPEDNIIAVVMNNVDRDVAKAVLSNFLQSMESEEAE